MRFRNLDLKDMKGDGMEGIAAGNIRTFISMALGLLVFVGIIALSVFFIFIRGEEQTMAPYPQHLEPWSVPLP